MSDRLSRLVEVILLSPNLRPRKGTLIEKYCKDLIETAKILDRMLADEELKELQANPTAPQKTLCEEFGHIDIMTPVGHQCARCGIETDHIAPEKS